LLESIGGSIQFRSTEGTGTEVKIKIPVTEVVAPMLNVKSGELLILDDDPLVIDSWRQHLKDRRDIRAHYFMDPDDLKDFVSMKRSEFSIITDFDLKKDKDGLD